MSERTERLAEIAKLEERRKVLLADEGRLHAAFMAEDNEAEANRIAAQLEDICGELDEISDLIGCAAAILYDIEAAELM